MVFIQCHFFVKPCLSYRLVFTKWELVLKSFSLTKKFQHILPSCLECFVFTNNHGTSVCISIMICQILKKWKSCNAHYGNKTQIFTKCINNHLIQWAYKCSPYKVQTYDTYISPSKMKPLLLKFGSIYFILLSFKQFTL